MQIDSNFWSGPLDPGALHWATIFPPANQDSLVYERATRTVRDSKASAYMRVPAPSHPSVGYSAHFKPGGCAPAALSELQIRRSPTAKSAIVRRLCVSTDDYSSFRAQSEFDFAPIARFLHAFLKHERMNFSGSTNVIDARAPDASRINPRTGEFEVFP